MLMPLAVRPYLKRDAIITAIYAELTAISNSNFSLTMNAPHELQKIHPTRVQESVLEKIISTMTCSTTRLRIFAECEDWPS
jgi:hypothetical protein